MELAQILQRLDYTISKAKELKPEQFNYSAMVKAFDYRDNCGTICCIAGHYPNWGIEGFSYSKSSYAGIGVSGGEYDITSSLGVYHGLKWKYIAFMFFGYPVDSPLFSQYNYTLDLSLPEVIERFEYVRKLLASGEITPNQDF